MRIVIDTNVAVSALLSPDRVAAQLLDLVIAGEVTPLYDDRITAEYRSVLARPRFGFGASQVSRLIGGIVAAGEHVAGRPLAVVLPDADDVAFAEVALTGGADALVTGNARHFVPSAN